MGQVWIHGKEGTRYFRLEKRGRQSLGIRSELVTRAKRSQGWLEEEKGLTAQWGTSLWKA